MVFPTTYEIKVKDEATNITGTVASPSRPSVKFTAFDAPIIINKPKGIKNNPICKTKFLKMENEVRKDTGDQSNI